MPKKKTLASKLKKAGVKQKTKPTEPLWKGPEVDGVTQSMLSAFLVCRERFRLKYVEGLRPPDEFNHRIEYGNMWHLCEEHKVGGVWPEFLLDYARKLCKRYPLQQEQINHWFQVCQIQFPIYVDYWEKQKTQRQKKSLLQEYVFNVPYELPSGRVVKLRGMMDEVSLEGKGKNAGIYLDEHKTKADIKEEQIRKQLQFDLQTMIYLVALQIESEQHNHTDEFWDSIEAHLGGVNYNVVQRPLSGGKGTIRQHKATKNKKAETTEHFYDRLRGIIEEEPEHYFVRWKVEVSSQDIERFKREFLDPILESLCDWYEAISFSMQHEFSVFQIPAHGLHWRTPYGFYNILAEGGSTKYDEYLATGSMVGLERGEKLFRELESENG